MGATHAYYTWEEWVTACERKAAEDERKKQVYAFWRQQCRRIAVQWPTASTRLRKAYEYYLYGLERRGVQPWEVPFEVFLCLPDWELLTTDHLGKVTLAEIRALAQDAETA